MGSTGASGAVAESAPFSTASLNLAVGNELAHSLLAHVARTHGIRALSIKGLVSDHYRLRTPRASSDADVLIDPRHFDAFCELLRERGWHERVEREVPALLGHHSVTLINDTWPNDIDAHRFFPGFFADHEVVFDRLWESSALLEVAHTSIRVPSRAGAAVIGLLHAVRYTRSSRHRQELDELASALRHFSDEERSELVDITASGRAQWVLADVIRGLGVEPADDATAEQKHLWRLNRETTEDGSAVSWAAAVRHAPLRRKLLVLVNAVWIPRKDIPRNDPAAIPTRREAWAHRMLRWRRGVVALVHYSRIAARNQENDR